MAEIEFLHPDPAPGPADEPAGADGAPAPVPARRHVAVLGPALLWLAAAVLSLVAPFRSILRVDNRFDAGVYGFALDGWGRYRAVTGSAREAGINIVFSHGNRYGVPLAVCAGVLVLIAAVHMVASRGPTRLPRLLGAAPMALGLLAGGAAAGLGCAGLLTVITQRDALRLSRLDSGFGAAPTVTVTAGSFGWYCLAAAVCAAAGAVLALALPVGAAPPVGAGVALLDEEEPADADDDGVVPLATGRVLEPATGGEEELLGR